MKEEFESRLGDMKAQYVGEKSEYQLKLDELQSRLRKITSELTETKTYHEKVMDCNSIHPVCIYISFFLSLYLFILKEKKTKPTIRKANESQTGVIKSAYK